MEALVAANTGSVNSYGGTVGGALQRGRCCHCASRRAAFYRESRRMTVDGSWK
jgi:hypothetical protein